MRRILRTAAPVLVLLLCALTLSAQPKKKAPDFTLTTADGKTVQLSKLKGKIVIVNFWATWCGPCRREIPDFVELYKEKKSTVEIIGISVDENGWTAVRPFLQKNTINYPIVIADDAVVQAYGPIEAIPATFIVDKQGMIVDQVVGGLTKKALEAKLAKIK